MSIIDTLHSSFQSGQISDRLFSRVDTLPYSNGAKQITNWLPILQGGVRRAPGTIKRASFSARARTELFRFGRAETYIFAFLPGELQVVSLDGALIQSITGQPWTATTILTMSTEQSGNNFFISDQTFFQQVTRTAANAFTSSSFSFARRHDDSETYQPWAKFSDDDVTLTLAAISGSGVALTASADVFDALHVGTRFQIRGGEVEISTVVDARNATCAVKSEVREYLDPAPLATHNGEATVTVTAFDHRMNVGDQFELYGVMDLGGIVAASMTGARTVGEVLDSDRFTFEADTVATDSLDGGGSDVWLESTAATRKWAEPAFSNLRGWPQAVGIHQNRLYIGGSALLPEAIWASKTFDLTSFDLGEGNDSDAVKLIGQAGGNSVRHLVSFGDLMIFGDTREGYVPELQDQIVTQTNARILDAKTRYGAAYVPPVAHDGTMLFADALGQSVWQIDYSSDVRGFVASPLSALEPAAIDSPVDVTVFEGAKDDATPFIVFTNADGSASVFRSQQSEQAAGWFLLETDGLFRSFVGAGERLYAVVERTISGATVWYLEEFDFDRLVKTHASVNATSAATKTWTGFIDLAGKEVDVVDGDGQYLERVTVSASGGLTTSDEQTEIWAGLPFTATLETLPPAPTTGRGSRKGKLRGIAEIVVDVKSTPFLLCDGVPLLTASEHDIFGGLTDFTGDYPTRAVNGFSRRPTVILTAPYPLDAIVNGIAMEVEYV